MNQFFTRIWNHIKDGYCFARDYIANKVAKIDLYGDRLIAQAVAEDSFTKRLQGMLCKVAAFVLAFFTAFTAGYIIGMVFGLLLGPILGLIAIPLAYMVGEDFGSAITRAQLKIRIANLFAKEVRVTEVEDIAFAAA
jgi:hypothetical protein